MTYDGVNHYTWTVDGKMATISGTTTASITYDAFGRMVEKAVGSAYTQIVYSPLGKKYAVMSGTTLQRGFIPLPTGATAVYTPTGLAYIRHHDHLGSSRLATTPNRTLYSSTAYAPFGEAYASTGTTDLSFTGQDQDTTSGMHDFLARRYMPVQGRWLSPDPKGINAVDPSNPQTWNRYAYVMNNPLALVDPFGEDCYQDGTCGQWSLPGLVGGGGGFGGYDPFQLMTLSSSQVTLPSVAATVCDENGCYVVESAPEAITVYTNMNIFFGGYSGQGPTLAANNGLTISAASPTPWYKNPCVTKAIAKGALSTGIDAIGLIPGGGAVSEGLSLFHGAAAVSNGTAILGRLQLGAGIITTANGASNSSPLGAAQTALGVGGIVVGVAKAAPVFGQVLSGLSVVGDLVGTGMEIAQCR